MIEIVYKEEKQEAKNGENLFNLPRNIRQIGLTAGNIRIYIEDYVYTFLTRLARNETGPGNEQGCVAVFTGDTKWNNGITYLFIRGALMVEDMEAAADHIDFSEKVWTKIQENQAKYFPGQEITGWFFSRPQMYMETDELLTRIHLRYFGGEKVLMLMEPTEKEEAFFFYENGLMIRQRGYYIYYEKNPLMQEYMIEKTKDMGQGASETVGDEAVTTFRKIIKNKKTPETEEKPQRETEHTSVFSYAATACLVLAVLAVGAGFYRNYMRIAEPSVDSTVTVMSDNTVEESEDNQADAVREVTKTPEITWIEEITKALEETDEQPEESLQITPTIQPGTENGTEEADVQETDTKETGASAAADSASAEESQETVSEDKFSQEADERKAKKEESQVQLTPSAQASSDSAYETYIIKPGDTLYQISISHYGNMDAISEICRLNNLKGNQVIYPGQMIVLP